MESFRRRATVPQKMKQAITGFLTITAAVGLVFTGADGEGWVQVVSCVGGLVLFALSLLGIAHANKERE